MSAFEAAPRTIDQLLKRIAQEYDGLSRQLKLIAHVVEPHRDELCLLGIRQLAQHCGVHPSAVVRFAKYFGFSGFSDMRGLFRNMWLEKVALALKSSASDTEIDAHGTSLWPIADEVLVRNIVGLEDLRQTLDRPAFEQAVQMLNRAEMVWVVGAMRAFPVAVHLEHALQHAGKRVGHLGAFESLHVGQARAVRAGDLLLAISLGLTRRRWPASCSTVWNVVQRLLLSRIVA